MALEPKQITPQIYQGGWLRPQNVSELIDLGITHVLNLDLPYDDPQPCISANIILANIFIRDACLMTPQIVRDAIGFIDRALSSSNHKIYIHCIEGVSRSPTITWLYLIHRGSSPEEAAAKVRPNRLLYDAMMVQQLINERTTQA
jgi:protein-tyrosine phosphatase